MLSCRTNTAITEDLVTPSPNTVQILALGDSYTIGHSVCETCRFPVQLQDSLEANSKLSTLKLIAKTGWTTSDLKTAIASETIGDSYDIVTLLIGVNNQYQHKPFSLYETEFPELVQTAITAANGDKNKLVVISIPDYAFTPFGQSTGNAETISEELDSYNAFAENYCQSENITFLNITDITREGLENPNLVASDGLHPSQLAYSKFVERLLPIVLQKLE